MKTFPSLNRGRLRRSSLKTPCPVCGKTGCGQSEGLVICWRVQDGAIKQAANGAWLHTKINVSPVLVQRRIEPPRASI
jgi:hypothetical protein